MANPMTERGGQPIALQASQYPLGSSQNANRETDATAPLNSPTTYQTATNPPSDGEPIPLAPPPAYIPPPECRTSRIYGLEDIGNNGGVDNDLERSQPPPPYSGPTRQPTIFMFSRPVPQPVGTHSEIVYPTMEVYVKANRRRRLYAAACFTAFLVLGIILLVNLLRPRD